MKYLESFAHNPEAMKWFKKTPKHIMAEMLRQYAMRCTEDEVNWLQELKREQSNQYYKITERFA